MWRRFVLIALLCSMSPRLACFILCAGESTDSYLLYHTLVSCCSAIPQCLVWFLYFLLHRFLQMRFFFLFVILSLCSSNSTPSTVVLSSFSPVSKIFSPLLHSCFYVVCGLLKCQVCFGWPMWPFWLPIGKEWRCWWPTSRSWQTSSLTAAPRSSSGTQER